jgi:type VI secretion system secreted protein Hcp
MDALFLDLTSAKIDGECLVTGHIKSIEVLSFSHGVAQQITGDQSNTKRTSGKPNHQDFTVTKYMDLASATIIDHCNQAKVIPTAKFTVGQTEAGKVDEVMLITMTNALVSSYSVGGGGGGKPQETVTFNYTKIDWAYKAQKSDVSDAGTSKAVWDLATSTAK